MESLYDDGEDEKYYNIDKLENTRFQFFSLARFLSLPREMEKIEIKIPRTKKNKQTDITL